MNDKFRQFLKEHYPSVRSSFPREGRRKWRLRIIEALWLAPEAQAEILSAALNSQIPQESEVDDDYDDPLDELTEGPEPGLLIRTDFSNDAAWDRTVRKIGNAEEDMFTAMTRGTEDVRDAQAEDDEEMNADTSSESEPMPLQIIKIITVQENALFDGISNLTALRLLNDATIRLAPTPPTGISRTNPGNRLEDRNGLQEIYTGKTIWIYDNQSNTDQSIRLVSQSGDMCGTATGDSWRARATHVPELQFNMTYHNMKVDFGGLDRWDHSERRRNLNEAEGG